MITIKDVAKAAGVSVATTSRVINNAPHTSAKARHAVQIAMKQLGYRPNANARALVSQSNYTVGVLVNNMSSPFFGEMVDAINGIVTAENKQLLVGSGLHQADKEAHAIELLANSGCRSLIIHSKGLSDTQLLAYLNEFPAMVILNRVVPKAEHRCIALDNFQGAFMACEYLIQQGHHNIGYICSEDDIEDARDRLAGHLAALKAHNIQLDDDFIAYGEPNEKGGEKTTMTFLAKNLPVSAIACYNDDMAAGCMSVLHENNIEIPAQISVIGFDNSHIAQYLYPKLTTMHYPIKLMAEQAAKEALALAQSKLKTSNSRLYKPTLVRRYSVAPVA